MAEVCGVSEKTVLAYFPTKEALLLDRLDGTADALRAGLADPAATPVEAPAAVADDVERAVRRVRDGLATVP